MLAKQTMIDCISRLEIIHLKLAPKNFRSASKTVTVVRQFLVKLTHFSKYLVAIYFRVEMFYTSLNNVALGFISKVSDLRFLSSAIQHLEENTSNEIVKDPNVTNWFFLKRTLLISTYLEGAINEPFRFKLEDHFFNMTAKRLSNWKQKIDENLSKAYILCKLCGQSISLRKLGPHSKLCFSSYEMRDKAETINKQLLLISKAMLKEVRKLRFLTISKLKKMSSLKKEKAHLSPKSFFSSKMHPISLAKIIQEDFRNSGLNLTYFPEELVDFCSLVNARDSPFAGFRRKSLFYRGEPEDGSPSSVSSIKFLEPGIDLRNTFPSLDLNSHEQKSGKSFDFSKPAIPAHSEVEDTLDSTLRFHLPRFKPDLTREDETLYLKSIDPGFFATRLLTSFSHATGRDSPPIVSFKWSVIRGLRKKQRSLFRLSCIISRISEFPLEECKLKQKIKKWLVLVNNLYREDLKIDIVRIRDLIEEKIGILVKFEEGFQHSSTTGQKRKMKSEVFESNKEIVEEEQQFYGSAKLKIKSLRHSITSKIKQIVDLAVPIVNMHKKILDVKPVKKSQGALNDEIQDYLLEELQLASAHPAKHSFKLSKTNSLAKTLSAQANNSWKRSALRGSIIGSFLETAKSAEIIMNHINDLYIDSTDYFFFSEDEAQNREPEENIKADRLDDIASYHFIRILGKGAYGVVWLVKRKLTGDLYAMKLTDFSVGLQ